MVLLLRFTLDDCWVGELADLLLRLLADCDCLGCFGWLFIVFGFGTVLGVG